LFEKLWCDYFSNDHCSAAVGQLNEIYPGGGVVDHDRIHTGFENLLFGMDYFTIQTESIERLVPAF
jgi:hypothetical protein